MLSIESIENFISRTQIIDSHDNAGFRYIINQALDMPLMDVRSMAETIGTSLPTVRRWKNGNSMPHPVMRPVIFKFIRMRAVEMRDTLLSQEA